MKKGKTKPKTNPNGANQFLLDPRQDKCWGLYINPKSGTYGNAYQSAIKAGYAKTTGINITKEKWFLEKTRRLTLGNKGEKVLEETLDMETNLPVIGQFGPIMIPTGKFNKKGREIKELLYGHNDKLLRIKQDSAKFVAERLLKKHYSSRTEITAGEGKDLPTPIYGGLSVKK